MDGAWPITPPPRGVPLYRIAGTVFRSVFLAVVLAAPVLLPAFAHASLPDPSWRPGIYDGGDHDDVIAFVGSLAGSIGRVAVSGAHVVPRSIAAVPPPTEGSAFALLGARAKPRAPPLDLRPLQRSVPALRSIDPATGSMRPVSSSRARRRQAERRGPCPGASVRWGQASLFPSR